MMSVERDMLRRVVRYSAMRRCKNLKQRGLVHVHNEPPIGPRDNC